MPGIAVVFLFAFSPLKTRPVTYEDRFGNVLTIYPNCKDSGFSFTLIQASEKCAEAITGGVRAGDNRYRHGAFVLLFDRRINAIEITEEGRYAHGASCGEFTGLYYKKGRE